MDLILWRHAEAEPGDNDLERALTSKGRKQAARVARWLDQRLPGSCRILVSPAKRAQQTVLPLKRKFKTKDALSPDVSPQSILVAANWPNACLHNPLLARSSRVLRVVAARQHHLVLLHAISSDVNLH